MTRIEIDVTQNTNFDEEWGGEQGITAIVLDGDKLRVEGWFDDCAAWRASITLTADQKSGYAMPWDDIGWWVLMALFVACVVLWVIGLSVGAVHGFR